MTKNVSNISFFVSSTFRKLVKFKQTFLKERTKETILSPEVLNYKVEKLQPTAQHEKILKLLNKFTLMPTRFAGTEIELVISFFSAPEAVSKSLCHALALRFGSALKRPITVIDPPNISSEFNFLNYLYAQDDGCDLLTDAPENTEYKLVAKLAFGEEDVYESYNGQAYYHPRPVKAIIFFQVVERRT